MAAPRAFDFRLELLAAPEMAEAARRGLSCEAYCCSGPRAVLASYQYRQAGLTRFEQARKALCESHGRAFAQAKGLRYPDPPSPTPEAAA